MKTQSNIPWAFKLFRENSECLYEKDILVTVEMVAEEIQIVDICAPGASPIDSKSFAYELIEDLLTNDESFLAAARAKLWEDYDYSR